MTRKIFITIQTGPMGTVILYEAQKRLGIKTSDGFKQFLITPSNHDEKDMRNLEKKTKTTLALLNSSTPGVNHNTFGRFMHPTGRR